MHQDLDIHGYQEQFSDNPTADFVLVDVREIEEYQQGHIPNAVNIPLNSLPERIAEIPADKHVVLVCARGGRSAMAAEFLTGQGYRQLYNLVDGTIGWMERGLLTE